ncbi:MAG: hypothetical protein ACK56I_01005, partial [bacterium]
MWVSEKNVKEDKSKSKDKDKKKDKEKDKKKDKDKDGDKKKDKKDKNTKSSDDDLGVSLMSGKQSNMNTINNNNEKCDGCYV